MIITIPWLKEHLRTSAKESEIIEKLTDIGLEVEEIKENSGRMGKFKIAKVLNLYLAYEPPQLLNQYSSKYSLFDLLKFLYLNVSSTKE